MLCLTRQDSVDLACLADYVGILLVKFVTMTQGPMDRYPIHSSSASFKSVFSAAFALLSCMFSSPVPLHEAPMVAFINSVSGGRHGPELGLCRHQLMAEEQIGGFTIQLMGFFFMTVFMFALAVPYHQRTLPNNRIGFVIMYSFTFFFTNFGPNATTFVVPAEIFPVQLNLTLSRHICGGWQDQVSGGCFQFYVSADGTSVRKTLMILGMSNFFGIVFTFLAP
ncbi:hypothetical protein NL676_030957 [Syzygium grande]|nr:hypothetical protein NL676_030957 [Syzygium grande]